MKISKNEKLIIKGIIIFLLFWNSAQFQRIPIYLFHLDIYHLSDSVQVLLSAFSSLVMALILFIIYRKELMKEFKIFMRNPIEHLDTGFYYYAIGFVIMLVSNLIINFILGGGGASNEQVVQKMIQALPIVMIIEAGFLAPFTEEIVFRKTIKDVVKNPYLFAFLSFLLFGGAHVLTSNSLMGYLYIIPYGALGAAFAFAYYKTDTIFTSMTIHMIHNTLLILISILL